MLELYFFRNKIIIIIKRPAGKVCVIYTHIIHILPKILFFEVKLSPILPRFPQHKMAAGRDAAFMLWGFGTSFGTS